MDQGVIYLALVHHPVRNREGRSITSALTNLDIHDCARAARTYGLRAAYMVTPVEAQMALARTLLAHWLKGRGGESNPERREALGLIRLVHDVDRVRDEVMAETGRRPRVVATTARGNRPSIGWLDLRQALCGATDPLVLLFGTASGLEESVIAGADAVLEPIRGPVEYNHLSVRGAVAVALDRLLGRSG